MKGGVPSPPEKGFGEGTMPPPQNFFWNIFAAKNKVFLKLLGIILSNRVACRGACPQCPSPMATSMNAYDLIGCVGGINCQVLIFDTFFFDHF